MKNSIKKISFLALILAIVSCKKNAEKTEKSQIDSTTVTEQKTTTTNEEAKFDISKIAVSTAELGEFPYFKLPEGYVYTDPDHYSNGKGNGLTMDPDKEYFLIDGKYFPEEGQTFKDHIKLSKDATEKNYNPLEIEKYFDAEIAKMGGVKINNGIGVKDGEKDLAQKADPQAYAKGYFSSSTYFDNIHTYVIHKADFNVFIQYNLNFETGYITVLKNK